MKRLKRTLQTASAAILLTMTSQAEAGIDHCDGFVESIFPSSWCIDSWFIQGDLLYLEAFEDGLSNPWEPTHLIIGHNSSDSSGRITTIKGLGKEPRFRWDLGFRVGTGFDFQDCKWKLAAYWTHYTPKKTKHSHHSPSWKLNYDTVDLIAGYKCEFNQCFTLDAYAGLRAAKIDSHTHGKFESRLTLDSDSEILHVLQRNKQSIQAFGAFIGARGQFDLGCGFILYADGDAGSLFGRNRIHSRLESDDSSNTTAFFFKRHQTACQYFVDSSAGIRWETCLCNNMYLTLKLGVEHHLYFDYNRIGRHGNLSIDGGTFSAALNF